MRAVWTARAGLLAALASVAIFTFSASETFSRLVPFPSPALMREIAGIGATILLGYVIEAVWMVQRLQHDREYEFFLGVVTGIAIAGFIGVVAALLVSEHRAAHHGNLLDDLGLWWTAYSLGFLGLLVALQPMVVARWTGAPSSGPKSAPH